MWDFLSNPLQDNTAQDWLVAAVVVVVVIVVLRAVIGIGLKRLKSIASKTETDIDDLVTQLLEKTKFVFVALVAIYAGAISLTLPPEVDDILSTILVLGFLVQGAFWANGVVNYMLGSWAQQKFEADPTISTALGSVGFLVRFAVWAIFAMLALDNLGIDIGPLVASLGIGGVALALALQGVLGDLFASLTIVFDRPFAVGDYIQVGDMTGTVQHVGLKSTRILAPTGEQLVFSNADLLGSRIQNFQHHPFAFLFGGLAGWIGTKRAIFLGLTVYAGISMVGYFMTTATHFYILAVLVGMVQGGTQALSRSLFGSMIPRHESGEFFGLFAVFEKFAGIMGPALFSLMIALTGSSRNAILSVIVFFVVGGLLLLMVNVEEGQKTAREAERQISDSRF